MKYRILSVLLAAAFLLGAGALYKGDFWTLRTDRQKEDAITEYASNTERYETDLRAWLHPVLLQDEIIGSHRVLTFTDQEIPNLLGYVLFRCGIFGGWQPLSASYGADTLVQTFYLEEEHVRVVFAANCPSEAAYYKVQANLSEPDTLMAEGDVTSPAFFHTYSTDRNFFPQIYLYDAEGRELPRLASDPSVPSPSIGSAETNLIYVFCAIVLWVGFLVVRYCWLAGTEKNTKEDTAAEA